MQSRDDEPRARPRIRVRAAISWPLTIAAAASGAFAALAIGSAPACVVQAPGLDASVDVAAEAAVVECDLSGDCDTCQACVQMLGSCTDEIATCNDSAACGSLVACFHACDAPVGGGGAGGGGGGAGAGGDASNACRSACCTANFRGINAYEKAQACAFGVACPISCVGRTYHCP